MQFVSQLSNNTTDINAILAKNTPIECVVKLGEIIASILNEAVPLHLHQAHLQLLIHCATAAMNGASQEHKAAAACALQGIVSASAAIDAEPSKTEYK